MIYSKQEILNDIKNGVPLIITDDENRENEGDFFVSAKCINHESLVLMLNEGRGLICAPMSRVRAEKLKLLEDEMHEIKQSCRRKVMEKNDEIRRLRNLVKQKKKK